MMSISRGERMAAARSDAGAIAAAPLRSGA
jgi:hypothetical protein